MDAVNGMMNAKIKISVAKDKPLMDTVYDIDTEYLRTPSAHYITRGKTYLSDYSPKWEKEEVDVKTLIEYINKRYAIKINC